MDVYVSDHEYAVTTLLRAITYEEDQLKQLHEQHSGMLRAAEDLYQIFLRDEFSERANYSYAQWYTVNGRALPLLEQIERKELSIENKKISISTLSGALLQIGKQGLSAVHGKKANCPIGRLHKGIPIRDIIWEGRNQSLHFEEGKPSDNVKSLFQHLERTSGKQFSATHLNTNLAKHVVDLLGWRSFTNFNNDMLTLS